MTANVFSWMAGQPVESKPKPRGIGGRPYALSPAKYEAIERMLREGKMTQNQIADALDIKRSTVDAMIRRIEAGQPAYLVDAPRYTEDQVRELSRLVAGGLSVPRAAKQVGLSENTAGTVIRYHLKTTVANLRQGATKEKS